jgi:hypothetical protein
MCGSKRIDGYVFCLGVDSLKDIYEAYPGLRGLIRSVTYLIRQAIFRSDCSTGSSGRSSLDICPLGELMDMYHSHEATKRHDKVYALLGMSSDDLSKVDLLPDYGVPWEELLQRLAKFLLPEKISVETWQGREIVVIKGKGGIFGKVTSVQGDMAQDDRQGITVTYKNAPGHPGSMGKWSAHWTLQVSAKPIRKGDLICLLQGALKPTIIRLRRDYFDIIIIAATPSENIKADYEHIEWPKLSALREFVHRDFLLVWDWEDSLEELQYEEEYDTSTRTSSWVLEHPKTEPESHLDRATRTWNVALILEDLKEYGKACDRFREAVHGYEMAVGEDASYMLGSQYGQTPLLWAAEQGHKAVVKLLLETGKVDIDVKDSSGWTPLLWAAEQGHEAVVKLLLEIGKVDVNSKDSRYGQTPLLWAAQNGHEAVVKLLLETGKFDVDVKDSQHGRTALGWAAHNGHEAVAKLLQSHSNLS